MGRMQDWWVCNEAESGPDHQYIEFKLREERNQEGLTQSRSRGRKTEAGISVHNMEVGLLLARWTGNPEFHSKAANANQRVRAVEELITAACDFTLERKAQSFSGKPSVHWWNLEIVSQRKACVASKRRMIRCSARLHFLHNRIIAQGLVIDITREEEASASAFNAYREARKNLRTAITRSKAVCWKQLIQSVDEDLWGKPYQLVTRKL